METLEIRSAGGRGSYMRQVDKLTNSGEINSDSFWRRTKIGRPMNSGLRQATLKKYGTSFFAYKTRNLDPKRNIVCFKLA